MAEEGGWDLVEIAPNAEPPVCRVMDYGKFRFEQAKKAQAAKKKQKAGPQRDELYNLKQDPAETNNVLADHAELAAKLKKFLNDARDRGFTRPDAGK